MQGLMRFGIATLVLCSGLALTPFVGMPAGAFGWQQYAAAYQPTLWVNFDSGRAGSVFRVEGQGFTPNGNAPILINETNVGQVPVDGAGRVDFRLTTTQANNGRYTVRVGGSLAETVFAVSASEPLRDAAGGGQTLDVPGGIAAFLRQYLPIITRNR